MSSPLHERSPSPSRNACSFSVPERAPSTTTVMEYDSTTTIQQIRLLADASRNAEFYGGCTREDSLQRSVRTLEWVFGPQPDDIASWFQELNVYGDKRYWFLDMVANVCSISIADAFDLICEHRGKINSIQKQNKCTQGEAAREWLLELRKANISETAVEKLQDYRDLSEAEARALIIEKIEEVIQLQEKQAGMEWDYAQSVWAWGWIEENPRKRPRSDNDENEDETQKSRRGLSTLGYSDAPSSSPLTINYDACNGAAAMPEVSIDDF